MVWKLEDAKNKFSKVMDMALEKGPQKITRRSETVVLVALEDFERLIGERHGFKEFLMRAPSMEGLSLEH